MEPALFPQMARLENEHWWWLARRAIVREMLAGLPLPKDAEILEAGCGTGGNLRLLSEFGRVHAMELDETARAFAQRRVREGVGAEIAPGRLPADIPFAGRNFDLIVLMDVLEHLDEEVPALRALGARLKPGGWLLLTVPACPCLWSRHDQTHHHRRRYRRGSLRAVVQAAELAIRFDSYYNTLLFPLVLGTRLVKRVTGRDTDDQHLPGPRVNGLLRRIFASERHLLRRRLRLPIGVSLLLLAQKNSL